MVRLGAGAIAATTLVLATACGGSAERDGATPSNAGSAGTSGGSSGKGGSSASGGAPGKGGSSTSGGSDGSGGFAEAGAPANGGAAGEPSWSFERPICGGGPVSNGEEFCGGPLTIAPPQILDMDGDELITAGDLLRFRIVTTNETESPPAYPCLGLAVEREAARLPLDQTGAALENPIFSGLYALVTDASVEYEFYGWLADDLPSGTTVRFLAWATALNSDCENSELEFHVVID